MSGQGSMPITNSLLSTAVRIQLETKALNYNIEKGLSESQAYLLATRIRVIDLIYSSAMPLDCSGAP